MKRLTVAERKILGFLPFPINVADLIYSLANRSLVFR